MSEQQLAELAAEADKRCAEARGVLKKAQSRVSGPPAPRPVTAADETIPAWHERPHGDLTRSRLAQQIAHKRRAGRLLSAELTSARAAGLTDVAEPAAGRARATAHQLLGLLREQRVRTEMPRTG
ncbi:hypothetical protein ACWEQL_26875 [Kitasatospora sp. NPDC004240]